MRDANYGAARARGLAVLTVFVSAVVPALVSAEEYDVTA